MRESSLQQRQTQLLTRHQRFPTTALLCAEQIDHLGLYFVIKGETWNWHILCCLFPLRKRMLQHPQALVLSHPVLEMAPVPVGLMWLTN